MSERDKIKGAGRYAYLLYDATFKLVICTPENEKLLIEILELLIPGKHIASITFINREQHGLVISEKNVTFDLLCGDPLRAGEMPQLAGALRVLPEVHAHPGGQAGSV